MKRLAVVLFWAFWAFWLPLQAQAQTPLSLADVPESAREILYFSLVDDQNIEARLLVKARAMSDIEFVVIPMDVVDVNTTENELALYQISRGRVVLAYKITPQLSAPDLFDVSVRPKTIRYVEESAFADTTSTEVGLNIRSSGLRRHIILNLSIPKLLRTSASYPSRLPDIFAFQLPSDFEGRTLPKSSSMIYPQSFSGPNPIVIERDRIVDDRIEFSYDIPESKSFGYFAKLGLRFVGMLIPVVLLGLTQPDKIDRKRYRWTFIITLVVIAAIYGSLIVTGLIYGANIEEIVIDVSFAIATALLAYLTNWIQTRQPARTA